MGYSSFSGINPSLRASSKETSLMFGAVDVSFFSNRVAVYNPCWCRSLHSKTLKKIISSLWEAIPSMQSPNS